MSRGCFEFLKDPGGVEEGGGRGGYEGPPEVLGSFGQFGSGFLIGDLDICPPGDFSLV